MESRNALSISQTLLSLPEHGLPMTPPLVELLPLIVLLPLAGALLPAFAHRGRRAGAWSAAAVALGSLLILLHLCPSVLSGRTLRTGWRWIPEIGLNANFRLDGLGLLFALLILGIGLLVILYARYYLSKEDFLGRFYALLLLFMASMLGIVLSENILLMFLFWELTSLSSFLLIGYWHQETEARQGAVMALVVTGGGGLALLAGFLLLGHQAGSYELSVILNAGYRIKSHSLYPLTLGLILLGAFTKSAQFPFHFWLPNAMAAPTPVSAYLHSATMVKAGIFLLARLFPALAGTDLWFYLVSGVGLTTLLLGAYLALFQHDLKGLLAYSTISHLGLITLLFGLGTPMGEFAGVFHIINHAIFKASLFMAAGIIDHEAGTRDMRRLNGLFRHMPHTAALAMVASLAMAGVPLLNGFLSKEMFFGETLHLIWLGDIYWALPTAAVLAAMFSVAYSVRFVHDVFFNGEPVHLPRIPHEPPRYMKIPVEILVGLCLLVGILPNYTVAPLLTAAASSVLDNKFVLNYDLAIWHGLNLPFLMSLLALTGGAVIYASRHRLFQWHDRSTLTVDGQRLFQRGVSSAEEFARGVTAGLTNGSLQSYLTWLILSTLTLGAFPFVRAGGPGGGAWSLTGVTVVDLVGALVLAVGVVGAVLWHRRRVTALIMASAVGLIVSLAFARFSGPDLAMTQLAVEVVTTLLLLLALYFLPERTAAESSAGRRIGHATIAGLSGLGAAALTWTILNRPHETISGYFLENSLPRGGGANVVNVILVDFRGFDTLGEITVLAIAALGSCALLKGLRLGVPSSSVDGQPWSVNQHPLIMRIIARPALPLTLLVALYLFIRGHHEPGGGFIAGLVTALGLIWQYLANGIQWTQSRIRLNYQTIIGLGLLAALTTGLASGVFDRPFLTSAFGHVHWPIVGEFELASAMAFDLGVFLTVVGVIMIILVNLSHLGEAGRAMTRSASARGAE